MQLLILLLVIAVLGAVGGIVNCAIAGEFVRPQKLSKVWRPGWIGNVVVGAVAAVVVGGMYGPLAPYVVNDPGQANLPPLTLAQLLGAIIVGLGGGNILTQMAQRQAERLAKDELARFFAEYSRSMTGLPVPAAPPAEVSAEPQVVPATAPSPKSNS